MRVGSQGQAAHGSGLPIRTKLWTRVASRSLYRADAASTARLPAAMQPVGTAWQICSQAGNVSRAWAQLRLVGRQAEGRFSAGPRLSMGSRRAQTTRYLCLRPPVRSAVRAEAGGPPRGALRWDQDALRGRKNQKVTASWSPPRRPLRAKSAHAWMTKEARTQYADKNSNVSQSVSHSLQSQHDPQARMFQDRNSY